MNDLVFVHDDAAGRPGGVASTPSRSCKRGPGAPPPPRMERRACPGGDASMPEQSGRYDPIGLLLRPSSLPCLHQIHHLFSVAMDKPEAPAAPSDGMFRCPKGMHMSMLKGVLLVLGCVNSVQSVLCAALLAGHWGWAPATAHRTLDKNRCPRSTHTRSDQTQCGVPSKKNK